MTKSISATKDKEPTTTYLVVRSNETLQVTVPSSWKVTYGGFNPGAKYGSEPALRFYEANDKQRAVFTNVQSFRDMSIPVLRKVVEVKKKSNEFASPTKTTFAAETDKTEHWEKEAFLF